MSSAGSAEAFGEVVEAPVFLAFDEAAYITEANLVVEGGWSPLLPGGKDSS